MGSTRWWRMSIEDELYTCQLCKQDFGTPTSKMTHNCPEKDEERCKKDKCARQPKDDSGYCAGHKPKPWTNHVGVKKSTDREIPVWEVEIHYDYVLRGKVEAPDRQEAKFQAEEEFEKRLVDTVHKDINQVGTKSESEVLDTWEKKPSMFRKLDTMEVESVTGEKS
jgi:hypothetical protein